MTEDEPAGGTINLTKEPVPVRTGPAWIVVPARIIALIVVLPLRLVHDLLVQIGRGLRRVWDASMKAPGRLARFIGRMLRGAGLALYAWLLAPLGRLAAAIGRGIAALFALLVVRPLSWLGHGIGALFALLVVRPLSWLGHGIATLFDLLLVRPLRWLGVVVILGFLRWFGRGSGRLGRWIYRLLIAPVGWFFAMTGRGIIWLLDFALIRPLRALGRGLAWLLAVTGRGFTLLFRGIGFLIGVLVVLPAALLWRYVLRPPLLGLAWLGGVLADGVRAFAAGLVWSWRILGRCLAWLGRVLFVIPAQALWRYVLAPIVAGVVGTWRLAARLLRRLWRTLVVIPVRVVVVAPARWVRTSVLRPIGRGVRETWRVSVREPAAAVRRTMRQASHDVRLTLRRTFRGK